MEQQIASVRTNEPSWRPVWVIVSSKQVVVGKAMKNEVRTGKAMGLTIALIALIGTRVLRDTPLQVAIRSVYLA